MKKSNDFFVELYEHGITFTTFCLPSPSVAANPSSAFQVKTALDASHAESANIQTENMLNEVIEPRLVSFINDPIYEVDLDIRLDDAAKAQFLMPERTERTNDFQIFVHQQSADIISVKLTASNTSAIMPDLNMGISLLKLPLSLAAGVRGEELKIEVVKLIYTSINRGQVEVVNRAVMDKQATPLATSVSATYDQAATDSPQLPESFSLNQNYPNPFNPSTTIKFQVPQEDRLKVVSTTLKIYDIRGRLVKTLIDENLPPGYYSVHWDGTNDQGEKISSGTYFYTIIAGGTYKETKKMIVLK